MAKVERIEEHEFRRFWTGLGPEALRALERDPLAANSPISLGSYVDGADNAPVVEAFFVLATMIPEEGLPLTPTGSLTPQDALKLHTSLGGEPQPVAAEEDIRIARVVRSCGEAAGLLQRKRGRLLLTSKAEWLLDAEEGPGLLLPLLVRGWARGPLTRTGRFGELVHSSWPLLVTLLHRFGEEWLAVSDYVHPLAAMNPKALALAGRGDLESRQNALFEALIDNLILDFGVYFGLIEVGEPSETEAAGEAAAPSPGDAGGDSVLAMMRANPMLVDLLDLHAPQAPPSMAYPNWTGYEEDDEGDEDDWEDGWSPSAGERAAIAGARETAAAFRRDLVEAIGEREFGSLEEVQAFADRFNSDRNRKPLEDFDGLSPEQMTMLLNDPLDPESPLVLAAAPTRLPKSPLFELVCDLTSTLAQGPLRATPTGNLPRDYVRAALARHRAAGWEPVWDVAAAPRGERDFFDLSQARHAAEAAGLVELRGKEWQLGARYHELHKNLGDAGMFSAVVEAVATSHLERETAMGDLAIIDAAWGYSLLLLERYGREWRDLDFYVERLIRAFPHMVEEARARNNKWFRDDPESIIKIAYHNSFFDFFAQPLGLIEVELAHGHFIQRLRVSDAFHDVVGRALGKGPRA